MKGHLVTNEPSDQPDKVAPLSRWEAIAVDAVGNVIEFWGFKRNQGRVWAFLYLRGEAFSASAIEKQLELSKGGVSMLLRDLERWGVVRRVRAPGQSAPPKRVWADRGQSALEARAGAGHDAAGACPHSRRSGPRSWG